MIFSCWRRCLVLIGLSAWLVSCGSSKPSGQIGYSRGSSSVARTTRWDRELGPVPVDRRVTPAQMLAEAGLRQSFIRKGTAGRKKYRPMRPRYITVHSTQNYTAGAWRHAVALQRGSLRATKRRGGNRIGYLTWHFSVEARLAVQHLPTGEQGEHADFDGPGNNYSIGIEMCEHRGNSIARTLDNAARLSAFLMWEHGIPSRRVVPHYHWERKGVPQPHKNCPHFLLDGGRPGRTWNWFLERVEDHYSRIVPGPTPRV
ncbi:MAG: peptidoglycan recognition protein family protein [Verrucomicrobiales bacterium]